MVIDRPPSAFGLQNTAFLKIERNIFMDYCTGSAPQTGEWDKTRCGAKRALRGRLRSLIACSFRPVFHSERWIAAMTLAQCAAKSEQKVRRKKWLTRRVI
jgi:hypothetical protein